MKLARLLVLTVTAALVPLAAAGQTVNFDNTDGTFAYDQNSADPTYHELSLSTLSNGLGAPSGLYGISGLSAFDIPDQGTSPTCSATMSCLGTVTLTTGTKASGSIMSNATFNPGGTFSVNYNGLGIIFTGTFSKAKWEDLGGGIWTFIGKIVDGMLTIGGHTYMIATAATVQLTTVGGMPVDHTNKQTIVFTDNSGTTNFPAPSVVPEPGTLALLGTGLIGIGFATRRRLAQRVD